VVFDTNSNTIFNTITHSDYCYSLAMHPDGSQLYVASGSMVQAIDTATNAITKTLTISSYDSSMNVHPDGSRLYITSNSPSNVSVVDTANLTLIATIPIEGYPKAHGNFVGYISESIAGKISQDGVGVADVKVTVASRIFYMKIFHSFFLLFVLDNYGRPAPWGQTNHISQDRQMIGAAST
jgi:YVTN family beta-propeller protein